LEITSKPLLSVRVSQRTVADNTEDENRRGKDGRREGEIGRKDAAQLGGNGYAQRVRIEAVNYPMAEFMGYYVIYDGNCNLCVTLVQVLERLDRGQLFSYLPMQDETGLSQLGITTQDCEQGMILIDADALERRWQGSDAAEEIGRLLPLGSGFVTAYRALPGLKWGGDRVYEQIRDHRYGLFGKRDFTYQPTYPACLSGNCRG
jgi:predicted DCC family thiol-disulfide oxidoreductase YuxK